MANGETQLGADMQQWHLDLVNMCARAKELAARYSDVAQADVNLLVPGTTLANDGPLTKLQWQQAQANVNDFVAFCENGAVATSWRRPIANGIAWAGKA